MADAKTVLEFARKHDAKILDLRFTDVHSTGAAVSSASFAGDAALIDYVVAEPWPRRPSGDANRQNRETPLFGACLPVLLPRFGNVFLRDK